MQKIPQRIGLGNILLYAIHRALQAVHPSCSLAGYYIVAQPIQAQPLLVGSRGASIAVRVAGPGDTALASMGRAQQEIASRFASPGVCLIAEKQARMVGFLWLLLGQYQEPDDGCTFVIDSPHAAWDLDVYVEPALRLSPVFARLWSEANGWLRARGIAWTLSRISCYNARSLQSHARLGSVKLGRMTCLKLGGLQFIFSSLAPYFHFSSGSNKGPVIRLRPPSELPAVPR